MTGLHGIHVLIGIILIAGWLLPRAMKGEFSREYYTPTRRCGTLLAFG